MCYNRHRKNLVKKTNNNINTILRKVVSYNILMFINIIILFHFGKIKVISL